MKRRDFMISAAGTVAGMALLPRMSFAAEGVIDWYTSSDSNILDFWTNTVKPAFEAANPGLSINLVDAGDGAGIIAIGERAIAAKQTNTDPQADYFESADALLPAGATTHLGVQRRGGKEREQAAEGGAERAGGTTGTDAGGSGHGHRPGAGEE